MPLWQSQQQSRSVADFEWYTVDRAVGNVRNQGSELIKPLGSD